MAKILVVDDEKNILVLFRKILTRLPVTDADSPVEVSTALNGEIAWSMIQTEEFDLIISDLAMGDMNGIELLQRAKTVKPKIPFIILTGVGTIEDAVKAIKLGAYDYVTKPFQHNEIMITIGKALEYHRLNQEIERLRNQLDAKGSKDYQPLLGKSKAMMKVIELIRAVASSDSPVLIEGESGTGKELVARAIHRESLRKEKPFIAVPCDTLPDALLESELFGHARGAFEGASHSKTGIIQMANGGTVFLDEIGSMSLAVQVKFLRAIQDREYHPSGSHEYIPMNVRFIASSHQPLQSLILNQRFREDLYYRLSVITIHLPPLRDRKEDIPYLVNYFIAKYAQMNHKAPVRIADSAMEQLLNYPWPGNIRELENVIERAVIITPDVIYNFDLPPADAILEHIQQSEGSTDKWIPVPSFHFHQDQTDQIHQWLKQNYTLKEINDMVSRQAEKTAIIRILSDVLGNRAEAARRLGISRPALYNKMKEYGIE